MNKKIIALICMLFTIGIASFNVMGMSANVELDDDDIAASNYDSIVDAGSITINNNDDDVVKCSYRDNFDVDVGEQGAIVLVKVKYNIKCPGFMDGSYIEIKFTDGSDKASLSYDGDSKTGYLTINKFVKPGDAFTVRLYAKLTDWYGAVVLNEDTSFSYNGACPGAIVNVGEMKVHFSDITINPKNPDEANPKVVELSPKGGILVVKCDWDAFFPNPLYTTFSIKANGGSGHSDSVTVKKWCGPYGTLHIGTYINADQKISISLEVEVKWAGEPPEIYSDKSWILAKSWDQTPSKPTIKGPTECKIKKEHTYTFSSNDKDRDDVYFYVDWGDGNKEEWVGPYPQGEEIPLKHTWNKRGDYKIIAQAKDETGLKSSFAEFEIKARLSRSTISYNPILQLLGRYPLLEQLLSIIL